MMILTTLLWLACADAQAPIPDPPPAARLTAAICAGDADGALAQIDLDQLAFVWHGHKDVTEAFVRADMNAFAERIREQASAGRASALCTASVSGGPAQSQVTVGPPLEELSGTWGFEKQGEQWRLIALPRMR